MKPQLRILPLCRSVSVFGGKKRCLIWSPNVPAPPPRVATRTNPRKKRLLWSAHSYGRQCVFSRKHRTKDLRQYWLSSPFCPTSRRKLLHLASHGHIYDDIRGSVRFHRHIQNVLSEISISVLSDLVYTSRNCRGRRPRRPANNDTMRGLRVAEDCAPYNTTINEVQGYV